MSNNKGYVYVPYIMKSTTQIVDSSFNMLKSRYLTTNISGSFYGFFMSKITKRISKIEKVFEIKNPTE
jgi:hypothetical protein